MLGLRAAQLAFRHPTSSATVTLFPMVHVGDRSFYEGVHADALDHDVVLVEGVRSPVTRRLTRAYRWIDLERLGLVLQPRLRAGGHTKARIVLADLSTEEFHAEWREVPLRLRLALSVGAPIFGLSQRFLATRESVAARMCLEDHRSSEEILSWTPQLAGVWRCVLEARDVRLIERLSSELGQATRETKRIAIVYGAQHMRAVSAELARRGFVCSESKWRELISL